MLKKIQLFAFEVSKFYFESLEKPHEKKNQNRLKDDRFIQEIRNISEQKKKFE